MYYMVVTTATQKTSEFSIQESENAFSLKTLAPQGFSCRTYITLQSVNCAAPSKSPAPQRITAIFQWA
jgi:hypothetical protein